MLLQWMMANGLVPDLDICDTWEISLCCRDTCDFFEDHRLRDLGLRAGWDVGIHILREIDDYCDENAIAYRINEEWRYSVWVVIDHRPNICQEIRRRVLRQ